MASIAADCAIFVHPTGVQVGQWEIPPERLIDAKIWGRTVAVYTGAWTMGLEKGCQIDFHFENVEQIKEFVQGLLEHTWISFDCITSIQPTFEDGRWKVEIVCSSESWVFSSFIAPVIFKGCRVNFREKKVVLLSPKGEKEVIGEQMKKAFIWLNRHTNNSTYRALSSCPEEQLRILGTVGNPRRYRGERIYTITSGSILKGEVDQRVALEFSEEEALDIKKKIPLVRNIMEFVERHDQASDELSGFIKEVRAMAEWSGGGPKDAVELEIWKNLLDCEWLVEKVQTITEKIWEDLIHLNRTVLALSQN